MDPETIKTLTNTMETILRNEVGGLRNHEFKDKVFEEIDKINKKSKKADKIEISEAAFYRELKKLYKNKKVSWLKRYPEDWGKNRSGAGNVYYYYKGQEKIFEQKYGISMNTISDEILLAHTKEIKDQVITPFLNQMPIVIDFSIVHPNIVIEKVGRLNYGMRQKIARATDGSLPPKRLEVTSERVRKPFYDRRINEPGVFISPTLDVENNVLWDDFFEHHAVDESDPLDLWKSFKIINERFWNLDKVFSDLLKQVSVNEFNLPMKYPLEVDSISFFLVDLLYQYSCNHQKYSSYEAKILLKNNFLDGPLVIQLEKESVTSFICGCMNRPFVRLNVRKYSGSLNERAKECRKETNFHLENLLELCESSPISDKADEIISTLVEAKNILSDLRKNLEKHKNRILFRELCPFVSDTYR